MIIIMIACILFLRSYSYDLVNIQYGKLCSLLCVFSLSRIIIIFLYPFFTFSTVFDE